MTRADVVRDAQRLVDDGTYLRELATLVAVPTESQEPRGAEHLERYLRETVRPLFDALDAKTTVHANPANGGPLLIAERHEDDALPAVLMYGHGDVVRGHEGRWSAGRSPWEVARDGERAYGRGTADNKGQHLVNLLALATVLRARGRLGFNLRVLLETGEETGSPGLDAFCAAHRDELAADVLIASDGPRLDPARPTIFGGGRGSLNLDLVVDLRSGAHHSGNWGGALANPGIILANALASIVDAHGRIRVPELLPPSIPEAVRASLAGLELSGGEDGPAIDPDWGEPGLTPSERVYAWNTFEVLAFETGTPAAPVNAIPARASAHVQMRFVPGRDPETFVPALRRHLDAHGFSMVSVTPAREGYFTATRLDAEDPWAQFAIASLTETAGAPPAVLPNLGGSIPNATFAETLGMPTVWVPHSYAACRQHAPDEHLLLPVVREGLGLMAGLFWDIGEGSERVPRAGGGS